MDNNTFSHGKSAFNLLLERIEDGLNSREDQPINRVEYRSRLIVRGSLSTALNEHHISRMRRAQGLQEAYHMWCPEGSVTICSHVNSLEAEITTPDLEYRSGMELAYKCLRNDKITGIVAINDMVAYGVLDALVREGYRVPEDFSLCGFDNVTSSGYQRIQLTTVDNNTFSHGKSAFNLLLERIEGGLNNREDQPINRVEYRSRLIVRGSTGKPRSTGL